MIRKIHEYAEDIARH